MAEKGNPSGSPEKRNDVDNYISKIKFDEKENKYIVPDDVPENIKPLVLAEKRRRDLQSMLDKEKLAKARLEAKTKALEEVVYSNLSLSVDEVKELEELKFEDPDAWREKLNALENQKKKNLSEKIKEIETQTLSEVEKRVRQETLQLFLSDNPDITEEDLLDNVPVRLQRKLDTGEISYTEYLLEAKKIFRGGKTVDTRDPDLKDLSNISGFNNIPDKVKNEDLAHSYVNDVF